MKPRYIFFALPLILLVEISGFSLITSLLRQQSDTAVLVGVVALCALLVFNFYLVKFLTTKTRP